MKILNQKVRQFDAAALRSVTLCGLLQRQANAFGASISDVG